MTFQAIKIPSNSGRDGFYRETSSFRKANDLWLVRPKFLIGIVFAIFVGQVFGQHRIENGWPSGVISSSEPLYEATYTNAGGATTTVRAAYTIGDTYVQVSDECVDSISSSYSGFRGSSVMTEARAEKTYYFSTTETTSVIIRLLASLDISQNQPGILGDQYSEGGAQLTAFLINAQGGKVGQTQALSRSESTYANTRNGLSIGASSSSGNSQSTPGTGNGTLNRLYFEVPPGYGISVGLYALSSVTSRAFSQEAFGRYASVTAGMGVSTYSGIGDNPYTSDDPTGIDDISTHPPVNCSGMAVYDFHAMKASLRIRDTPMGYSPPFGYEIPVTVVYTQRSSPPEIAPSTSFGPKWTFNWLSYIDEDPSDPTRTSRIVNHGGGATALDYLGAQSDVHEYRVLGRVDQSLIRRDIGAGRYELSYNDGSQDIYEHDQTVSESVSRYYLTRRIDPSGNTTTISYDSESRIIAITDVIGQQTTFSYSLDAHPTRVTAVTDPFDRVARFSYDNLGRLSIIEDVIGLQSRFTYEGDGDFVNSMTTPYGTTRFTNIEDGTRLRLMATDPEGNTEVVESNFASTAAVAASDPTELVPAGITVTNAHLDERNSFYWDKKQWKEAPEDYTKAHIYHWLLNPDSGSMSGSLESERPPLRSRIWYRYPDQSDPTIAANNTIPSQIAQVIEGGTRIVQRVVNSQGRIESETDPMGRRTSYQFDSNGVDLLRITQRVGSNEEVLGRYTYDSRHLPLTATDASEQQSTFVWNAQGQLTSTTNAKDETTTLSYYAVDADGKQRKARLHQIDGALAGSDDVTTFDYDSRGNLANVVESDGYDIDLAYDDFDRLTRTTYPDGTYDETTYLRLDPRTTRDRLGRLTQYSYNSLRQLVAVTDPADRTIRYTWCKCGSLNQLIDAMGRITRWPRDIAGRPMAKVYTDGSKIEYAYEPLSGRLSTTTDEKGQIKTQSYNLDGTLAGKTYTNAEHETPNVAFTYDAAYRRLVRMVDGIGTTNYTYVPVGGGFWPGFGAGQLASIDTPLPDDTLAYAYDELGRRTGYTINGVGESREYDALGRVSAVVNPLGHFAYTYHGATGRVDTITYPTGLSVTYAYHPLLQDFRLKDILHTFPGGGQLSRHSYEYNAVGNITRWTQVSPASGLNRSWQIGYDDTDQLTSVASQDPATFALQSTGQYAYGYDLAGNRLIETIDGVTTTATYNALNQLVSLSKSDGSSALPDQTYEWDAENRLLAVNYTGTSQRSEFNYDGLGRRHQLVEHDGTAITSQTSFVWKGLRLGEERDSTGNTVVARYLSHGVMSSHSNLSDAPEIGGLFALYSAKDHLGSIRELVTGTNAISSAIAYDPWGRMSILGAGKGESNSGYTGHWFHVPTMTSWPYNRQYEAVAGRWLNRDPKGESGGLNLYGYVTNSPLSWLDPDGAEKKDWAQITEDYRKIVNNNEAAKNAAAQTTQTVIGIFSMAAPLLPSKTVSTIDGFSNFIKIKNPFSHVLDSLYKFPEVNPPPGNVPYCPPPASDLDKWIDKLIPPGTYPWNEGLIIDRIAEEINSGRLDPP